jgi:hypothetical protein
MNARISLFLIAAGAVLLLAVPAGVWSDLNLHVTGVIVVVVGVLGLLLRSGARTSPTNDWLRRWVNPSGVDDPAVHDVQDAAAEDVREIREDKRLFDPHGPGPQRDEL